MPWHCTKCYFGCFYFGWWSSHSSRTKIVCIPCSKDYVQCLCIFASNSTNTIKCNFIYSPAGRWNIPAVWHCVWMYLIHRYVLQDWSDNDEIREQRGQPILTMSGMMQTVDKLFSASSLDNVRGTAYSIHINHSVTCYCKNEFLFKTFYSKSAFVSMNIFLFLHLLRIQCEQYDSCS